MLNIGRLFDEPPLAAYSICPRNWSKPTDQHLLVREPAGMASMAGNRRGVGTQAAGRIWSFRVALFPAALLVAWVDTWERLLVWGENFLRP